MNTAMLGALSDKVTEFPVTKEKMIEVKPLPKKGKVRPPVKAEPSPTPSLIVEEVTLPEMPFAKLAEKSLFAQFSYAPNLIYVTYQCSNDNQKNCWTAHGTGGHLSYDPQNIPAYFLRQKNYEESQQFRKVLLSFDVQSLTLKGKGDNVQEMEIKGTTAEGKPAYIELSVEGLE